MASNTPRLDLLERNLIINGNMDFWQRGTTFGPTLGLTGYHADRWKLSVDSSHTATVAQSTDVPTQAQSGYNSSFSWKITNGTGAATAAGGFTQLQYKMEGNDYQAIHNRKVRLQFWVKSSIAGIYGLGFANGPSVTRAYVVQFTINNANTWEKKTVDLQMDNSGTWNFDNTLGLYILWNIALGSNFQSSTMNQWVSANINGPTGTVDWAATTGATFQLAQVMFIPQDYTQAGSTTVDVPFQRAGRSIGHELQMCQRYYEKTYDLGTAPGSNASNVGAIQITDLINNVGTNDVGTRLPFRVEKRATPTITFYTTTGTSGAWTGYDAGVLGNQTGVTANAPCTTGFIVTLGYATTANKTISMWGHYTADSEL